MRQFTLFWSWVYPEALVKGLKEIPACLTVSLPKVSHLSVLCLQGMDRFLWWALEYTDEVFECCAVNVSDSIGDDCWSCHLWLMQPEVSLTLCHLKGVLVSLWIMFQKPPDSPTRPSPAATCVKASNKSACLVSEGMCWEMELRPLWMQQLIM